MSTRPQGILERAGIYIMDTWLMLPATLIFIVGNCVLLGALTKGDDPFLIGFVIVAAELLLAKVILVCVHRIEFRNTWYKKRHVRDVKTGGLKGYMPIQKRMLLSDADLNRRNRNPLAYSDPERPY